MKKKISISLICLLVEEDNKEMIEDTLAACMNELMDQLDEKEDEIREKITGQKGKGF